MAKKKTPKTPVRKKKPKIKLTAEEIIRKMVDTLGIQKTTEILKSKQISAYNFAMLAVGTTNLRLFYQPKYLVTIQLTTKSLKTFRDQLLAIQNNRCALCNELITINPVVDHDHSTGKVRGVLHKQCNWMLGKLEKAAKRSGRLNFIRDAVSYLATIPSLEAFYPIRKARKRRKRRQEPSG